MDSGLKDFANRYPFIKREEEVLAETEETDLEADPTIASVEGTRDALLQEAQTSLYFYNYEKAMNISLALIARDYDDREAHAVILETINLLGFKNELVIETRMKMRHLLKL